MCTCLDNAISINNFKDKHFMELKKTQGFFEAFLCSCAKMLKSWLVSGKKYLNIDWLCEHFA